MARFFKRRRRVYLRSDDKTGLRRWMLAPLLIFGVLAGGSAVTAVTGFIIYRVYASDMQPIEGVLSQNAGGAKIYDKNGHLLYEYVDDLQGMRQPVPLSEVSPYLVDATIATEDASFYSNPGVNLKGLLRAAYENFFPGNLDFFQGTGGSSITQQLVKNIYIPEAERQKRSISRKLKETVYAIELTNRYSKDKILEWYLNQIPYGGIYNGVEAAAQGYFGKKASELTLGEAALLAGIPACPSCYNPLENPERTVARRNQVLLLMQEKGLITKTEGWVAAQEPVNLTAHRFLIDAPHWVLSYVGPELEKMFGRQAVYREGLKVTTTLDLDLQKKAEDILENWISEFEGSGGHNGALVALDPTTGEILAYVGSRDYFRDDILGQNDMAQAFNSPGSAMKPFTYITSFMKLGWGPGTLVLDTPICYPDGDKEFCPRNPSGDYHGAISIRNALGSSLNVPAFKTILATGVDDVVNTAKKMGITGLDGRTLGPSFTIGGVDVRLVDMVFGYSVFANGGIMRGVPTVESLPQGNRELDPVSILKVEDSNGNVIYDAENERRDIHLVPPEYTYLINNILSDPQAQCITFGCGGLSIPGQHAAVKTGTSEPYENSSAIGDTWAMVYTPNLVVGVWAGNADNSPMYNIDSTSISWRSARDFMEAALEGKEALDFEKPDGVDTAKVCVPSNMLPTEYCGKTVEDLFVTDALPKEKDNWWQPFKIDIRTGLLATEMTPPQFVQQRVFLVLPQDLTDAQRQQAMEWASALGLSLAPTERSNPSDVDVPAVISSPAWNASVSGTVAVTGRAKSSNFEWYRLEYGSGASPSNWIVITQGNAPVTDATLGSWDTTGLTPGQYTLRLVVKDSSRGELVSLATVTVTAAAKETPTPTPKKQAAPTPTKEAIRR